MTDGRVNDKNNTGGGPRFELGALVTTSDGMVGRVRSVMMLDLRAGELAHGVSYVVVITGVDDAAFFSSPHLIGRSCMPEELREATETDDVTNAEWLKAHPFPAPVPIPGPIPGADDVAGAFAGGMIARAKGLPPPGIKNGFAIGAAHSGALNELLANANLEAPLSHKIISVIDKWREDFVAASKDERRKMVNDLIAYGALAIAACREGVIGNVDWHEGSEALENFLVLLGSKLPETLLRDMITQAAPLLTAKHDEDCPGKPPEWVQRVVRVLSDRAFS